jgi:telomerase reverse transcriptase
MAGSTIPGLQCHYPNEHVDRLKSPLWGSVLRLLGTDGDRIMLNLLVDDAIFLSVKHGSGNYYQLSGKP